MAAVNKMCSCSIVSIFVLLMVSAVSCSQSDSKQCEQKEKSLALIELAKDSITKAKQTIPDCEEIDNATHPNKSMCRKKEKVGAFIDVSLELLDQAKKSYPDCGGVINDVTPDITPDVTTNITPYITTGVTPDEVQLPADCLEILQKGEKRSGVYTIQPRNAKVNFDVYCDMDTDGGGWTVFQRRGEQAPQEDFCRKWKDYKDGFGNLTKEFWLGNDKIHVLSNQGYNTIRFDLNITDQIKVYALYRKFRIEDETSKYMLYIEGYSGTAGDSMENSNATMFSTSDKRNDKWSSKQSCSEWLNGAWWYVRCGFSNPNGVYQPGKIDPTSVWWYRYNNNYKNVASIEIKLRRNGPI